MLKSLWEVQSEREERDMGYIDTEAANGRSNNLQTAYLNLEHTNEMLRADLRAANKEIDRLKEHVIADLLAANREIDRLKTYVVDLKHDLDAAIKECETHHRESI